jgi:hypothetical protein
MIEFRLALEYGKSNKYMIEVWDGGRIVAVIHAEPYGLRISSRKIMHVDVSDDGREIYITLPSVVE